MSRIVTVILIYHDHKPIDLIFYRNEQVVDQFMTQPVRPHNLDTCRVYMPTMIHLATASEYQNVAT
jgi:hypothetical protein